MQYLVAEILVSNMFDTMGKTIVLLFVQNLISPMPETKELRGRENEYILYKYQFYLLR